MAIILLVPQTVAATWRVFCALACLLFLLCYFPLVLCPTLFTSSGVFIPFFPQRVLFATYIACGGRAFFPNFPKFGNNWTYICIDIRRRSVTIREILQKKQKKKSSSLIFQYLEKKPWKKYGRLKNCAKKMSKTWKKSSPK